MKKTYTEQILEENEILTEDWTNTILGIIAGASTIIGGIWLAKRIKRTIEIQRKLDFSKCKEYKRRSRSYRHCKYDVYTEAISKLRRSLMFCKKSSDPDKCREELYEQIDQYENYRTLYANGTTGGVIYNPTPIPVPIHIPIP